MHLDYRLGRTARTLRSLSLSRSSSSSNEIRYDVRMYGADNCASSCIQLMPSSVFPAPLPNNDSATTHIHPYSTQLWLILWNQFVLRHSLRTETETNKNETYIRLCCKSNARTQLFVAEAALGPGKGAIDRFILHLVAFWSRSFLNEPSRVPSILLRCLRRIYFANET